jgi:PAS domain S-box-containing protein
LALGGKYKLTTLIVSISIGALLLVSAVFVTVSYVSTQNAINREVARSFDYRNRIAELTLVKWLEKTEDSIATIVAQYSLNQPVSANNLSILEQQLWSFIQSAEGRYVDLLALVGTDQVILKDISSLSLPGAKPLLNAYLNQYQTKDRWQLQLVEGEGGPDAALIKSLPIVDQKFGRVVAYVVFGIPLNGNAPISNAMRRDAEVDAIEILINDQALTVSFFEKTSDTELTYLSKEADTRFRSGDQVLFIRSFMKDTLNYELKTAYRNNLIILGLSIAVAILVSLFLFRRITTTGFGKLVRFADNVRRGEEVAPYQAGDIVEFNSVGSALDEMMASISESEKALRESELEKRNLLNNTSSVIFIKDVDGAYIFINRMSEKLFHISEREIIGKTDFDVFPKPFADAFRVNDLKVINSDSLMEFEEIVPLDDGAHTYISVKFPLRNESGGIYAVCAISTDITDRKLAEKELAHHRDNLQELVNERTIELTVAMDAAENANKAKSEFLASMSHELRTPLNAIIGFSGAIKAEIYGPLGNPKYVDYLNDIENSGQHLLNLINDVLDVSAIEAGKLELDEEKISIPSLVDSSIHYVQQKIDDAEVSVDIDIPKDLPKLWGDKRRIIQILLNLLSNSVKFTQAGGKISLAAACSQDGGLSITVADTGIGMNDAELNKAMSKFGQVNAGLNRKNEGTGLGLPLAKSLVDLHQGCFDIQSEKGEGTIITISFPKERIVKNV